MDKNIANAMLLRLNKQDQIEALKSIGFTTVNENTPQATSPNICNGQVRFLTFLWLRFGLKTVNKSFHGFRMELHERE